MKLGGGGSVAVFPVVSQFFSWWGSELASLVPSGLASGKAGDGVSLILSKESGGYRLLDTKNSRREGGGEAEGGALLSEAEVLAALSARQQTEPGPIGIRLPNRDCFTRRLEVPAAAARDLARVLALSLDRTTPFKAKDVRTAHYVEPGQSEAGKLFVRQLIVKRTTIEKLKGLAESAGVAVSQMDCWNEDGSAPLPVNFLDAPANSSSGFGGRWMWPSLAGAAALLIAFSVYVYIQKHESALDELKAANDPLRLRAQQVREAIAKAQAAAAQIDRVRKFRTESVPKVFVLEEVTRLLPDTAYATDLKIEADTVDIAGLAKGASTLVPMFERSPLFHEAVSTAPVTFDVAQDKERFSIRARIRSGAAFSEGRPSEAGQ